jgi:hypothetical protein
MALLRMYDGNWEQLSQHSKLYLEFDRVVGRAQTKTAGEDTLKEWV